MTPLEIFIPGKPMGKARVYLSGECPICGVTMLSSVPKPKSCGACQLGRIARNANEAA